jgi:hypothetical protein
VADAPDCFRNGTALVFTDISTEAFRTYHFPGNTSVQIIRPLKLNVSASGGHRIYSADGRSHYIPPAWVHLEWQAMDDKPHFVA